MIISTNDFLIGYLSGKILKPKFPPDIINIIAPQIIDNNMKLMGFRLSPEEVNIEIIDNLSKKISKNAGIEKR